jgi:putative transposase
MPTHHCRDGPPSRLYNDGWALGPAKGGTIRFGNRYRVGSARLRGWDYRSTGWYFVTICTRDRRCWFGDVMDGQVRLSEVGTIVAEEWLNTEKIRPNVVLDRWVIMPNHLHSIVVITNDLVSPSGPPISTPVGSENPQPARLQSGSLGSIVGQFKSVCTKRIRAKGFDNFVGQSRFYDHIIRSQRALDNIRRYIDDNPSRWETDKENPINLPPRLSS